MSIDPNKKLSGFAASFYGNNLDSSSEVKLHWADELTDKSRSGD